MARQPDDTKAASFKSDDSALIRELASLSDQTSLTEIEIERAGASRPGRTHRQHRRIDAREFSTSFNPGPAAAAPAAIADVAKHPGVVPSPMVGTAHRGVRARRRAVHRSRLQGVGRTDAPDHRAYEDDEPDPVDTRRHLDEILVEDGQPVEFGEPLVIIEQNSSTSGAATSTRS